MTAKPKVAGPLVLPGEGQTYHAFGEEVTFLLEGRQTGGAMTAFLEVTPPGVGPPPHYHENEDETFFVLEGRISFLANGQWSETAAGGCFFAPRKSIHTFKNVGDKPSRMLIQVSPSGFENFFIKAADEFARSGGPDMNRVIAIAGEHGIHFVEP